LIELTGKKKKKKQNTVGWNLQGLADQTRSKEDKSNFSSHTGTVSLTNALSFFFFSFSFKIIELQTALQEAAKKKK
jgi:hypothetical protein